MQPARGGGPGPFILPKRHPCPVVGGPEPHAALCHLPGSGGPEPQHQRLPGHSVHQRLRHHRRQAEAESLLQTAPAAAGGEHGSPRAGGKPSARGPPPAAQDPAPARSPPSGRQAAFHGTGLRPPPAGWSAHVRPSNSRSPPGPDLRGARGGVGPRCDPRPRSGCLYFRFPPSLPEVSIKTDVGH